MTTISRNFLVFNKQGFQECMEKLTKRYKVEFSVKWGNTQNDVVNIGDDTFTVIRHHVKVDFSFEGYKIDGFDYIGCIKDEERMGYITIHGNHLTKDVNLSNFVNSFDGIPCHNCNRKHSRKIGHVFQVQDTKELIVFGSTCAKNYFGINFTLLLNFFERIETRLGEWDDLGIRTFRSNYIDFENTAKLGYLFCTKYGYKSVSKADMEGSVSTSSDVKESIKLHHQNLTSNDKDDLESMDIDFSILGTKEFVTTKENLTDFEHNIITIQEKINHDACSFVDIGMICYLVYKTFFSNETPEEIEFVLPEWEKGHKLQELEVELIKTHTFEGYYGVTNIYTFKTLDNIRLQWFTGINLCHKFDTVEIGDTFILNSTVKELKDDSFGKSVVITRTKLKRKK